MIKYEEWKDKKKDFFKVDVRHVQGNFFPGLQRRAMTLKAGEGIEVIQTFEPYPLYKEMDMLGYIHHTEKLAENEFHVWFYRTEEKEPEGSAPYRPLALLNYPMIDEDLGRIAADFWQANIYGLESAALDDVFELLAWNQGIGFFSSEIGPSPLFQAYKMIKTQEQRGISREEICTEIKEKFGEKNQEVQVL